MHEFISTLTSWYDQVRRLPKPTLVTLMKLGAKVASVHSRDPEKNRLNRKEASPPAAGL